MHPRRTIPQQSREISTISQKRQRFPNLYPTPFEILTRRDMQPCHRIHRINAVLNARKRIRPEGQPIHRTTRAIPCHRVADVRIRSMKSPAAST